jgi:hypothetical protein
MSRLVHLIHRYDPGTGAYVYNIRRPQPADTVFNPVVHFQGRETSTFLDQVMPCDYVQATWPTNDEASIQAAEQVITRGISNRTVPGWDGEYFKYFTGTCRDHIKAVFVPAHIHLDLKDLGLDMQPTSKAMKYLNRQLAPHMHSVMGNIVAIDSKEDDQHMLTVHLDKTGALINVLVRPPHPLVEGAHLCNLRGAQLVLGMEDPNIGDCLRVTGNCPLGLSKGHMMVADVEPDLILYGLKTGLRYDRFFFGVLSELHTGRPFSDFQSLINMLIHGDGEQLLEEHALTFFEDVMQASEDHDRMRKMFLGFTDLDQDNDWIMLEALKRDIDGIFPGLYRRQAKLLMDKVYHCGLGRIPLSDSALYGYVMPIWDMFESDGEPNPKKSRFQGNCVFSPLVNRQQTIAMYRQPNGNPREHWLADATPAPYKNIGKGQVVFIGPEVIEPALKAMGGGDFDDSVVLVHNPKIVDLFRRLPDYPRS